MKPKEYLKMALGGNMNISTLTLSAWEDILESYAKIRIKESGQPEMLELFKHLLKENMMSHSADEIVEDLIKKITE